MAGSHQIPVQFFLLGCKHVVYLAHESLPGIPQCIGYLCPKVREFPLTGSDTSSQFGMAAVVGHQSFNPLPLDLEAFHFTIQLTQLLLRRPTVHPVIISNPPVEVGTHPLIGRALAGGGRVVRQARQGFFNLIELVPQCFLFCSHEETGVFLGHRSRYLVSERLM